MHVPDQLDNAIQAIYDHFLDSLFDGTLPACTVRFHSEVDRTLGLTPASRKGRGGNVITLHSGFFKTVPAEYAMRCLVHEMVHLWQFHFGAPSPEGYHNAQFAKKSISIGLVPTSSGSAGGPKVGRFIIDYPAPGGRYKRAAPRAVAMWEAVHPVPIGRGLIDSYRPRVRPFG